MKSSLYVLLLVFFLSFFDVAKGDARDECGYYKKISRSRDSGHIKSPNYPDNYPNKYRCIWLLVAPKNKKFNVTVPAMNGEVGDGTELDDSACGSGTCADFLEIRSGAFDEDLHYCECSNTTSVSIETNSRWLWVKFQSNEENRNTGFRLEWELISDNGNADDTSPIPTCDAVNFKCDNQECVSDAYRCDGYHDCGCIGSGCDEHDCDGLGLSEGALVGLGVTLGFIIFTPLFVGIGCIDICLKRRAEKELKQKLKEARLKDRQKKMGALVAGTVGGAATVGVSRPVTAAPEKK